MVSFLDARSQCNPLSLSLAAIWCSDSKLAPPPPPFQTPPNAARGLQVVLGASKRPPEVEIRTLGHEAGPRRQPTSSWNCGEGGASRPPGAGPNDLQIKIGPPGPVFRVEAFKNYPPPCFARDRPMRNGSNGCTQSIKCGKLALQPKRILRSSRGAAPRSAPAEAHLCTTQHSLDQ